MRRCDVGGMWMIDYRMRGLDDRIMASHRHPSDCYPGSRRDGDRRLAAPALLRIIPTVTWHVRADAQWRRPQVTQAPGGDAVATVT